MLVDRIISLCVRMFEIVQRERKRERERERDACLYSSMLFNNSVIDRCTPVCMCTCCWYIVVYLYVSRRITTRTSFRKRRMRRLGENETIGKK